jgi:hypothetical protein
MHSIKKNRDQTKRGATTKKALQSEEYRIGR